MDIWTILNGGTQPRPNKPGAPFTPRTTCARGHSMEDAYVKIDRRNNKPRRECRTCKRTRKRTRGNS